MSTTDAETRRRIAEIVDIILAPEPPYDETEEQRRHVIGEYEDHIAETFGATRRDGGWVAVPISADGRHRLDVNVEAGRYRICETPLPPRGCYDRSWLYRRSYSPAAVILAAQAWGGGQDSEPDGWYHAWDGRERPTSSAPSAADRPTSPASERA